MSVEPLSPEARQQAQAAAVLLQRVYRVATGVILAAFVLLIIATTVSTGPLVQFVGKGLFYAMVGGAIVSAWAWYRRTRIEKRLGEPLS